MMAAHYVYRCYDAQGRLVYVGQTKNHVNRLRQHRTASFWASVVIHVRVSVHPSPERARLVEYRAIRDENPRFNIQGRWDSNRDWSKNDLRDFTRAVFEAPFSGVRTERLELLFTMYEERWGAPHPDAEWMRERQKIRAAEFDAKHAARRAAWEANREDGAAKVREIRLADAQGMFAHFAFCEECALNGDASEPYYSDDCPSIVLDEAEGTLLPLDSATA